MITQKKIGLLCSWPIILVTFFVFWPMGIVLLLRRASLDHKVARLTGKIAEVLGWITWALMAVSLVSCIRRGFTGQDAFMLLFFTVLGFFMIGFGGLAQKNAKLTEKYFAVIRSGLRRLDEIGAAVGKDYKEVKADLERMIKKGQLEDAYINESTYELVLPKNMEKPTEKKPEGRKVECAGCGADNILYGETGECEYCGSPLK